MKLIRISLLVIALIGVYVNAKAQDVSRTTIIIDKEVRSEKSINLKSITNRSSKIIKVALNGKEQLGDVLSPGENRIYNKICSSINAIPTDGSSSAQIWTPSDTKLAWTALNTKKESEPGKINEDNKHGDGVSETEQISTDSKIEIKRSLPKNKMIEASAIIENFKNNIESNAYLSEKSIQKVKKIIDNHIKCLNNWSNKTSYIQEQRLSDFLKKEQDSISQYRNVQSTIIQDFISYYDKYEIKDSDLCYEELQDFLNARIEARENLINGLSNAMSVDGASFFDFKRLDDKMLINIGIISIVLVLLLIWFVCAKKRKRTQKQAMSNKTLNEDGSPAIVIRRKTTSILKTQSLEDVIDNKEYLKIECSDFCDDSAVRRIYLKNTCVKDIYNMYAEDLRNPDNPKEDGCMVLGRWVFDNETNEYYVSLEDIVQPGDDAIFQEYELNFGGKIKLKVAEKLRKLRRETNLQYDLTCWVHSHPGLGVFFSNSDSNVQMQLKHPTHPNFLTAIVIDILTSQQELGIFTFKHNSTINSKNDLKKMYSLEEMHKWAVESDRHSFKAEDYFNVLTNAENHFMECYGIELNNSVIIDMCALTTETSTGLVGWAYGHPYSNRGHIEYVVKNILKTDDSMDNDLLGCFVIGSHCSIPSIRKAIMNYSDKIKFVLFYSTADETLISIPLNENQLSLDDKYYGEEKLENLKIWTRRKR